MAIGTECPLPLFNQVNADRFLGYLVTYLLTLRILVEAVLEDRDRFEKPEAAVKFLAGTIVSCLRGLLKLTLELRTERL